METQAKIGGGHPVWKEPRLVSMASTMMAMGRSTATTLTAGCLILFASRTGGVGAMTQVIISGTDFTSVLALVHYYFSSPVSVDQDLIQGLTTKFR